MYYVFTVDIGLKVKSIVNLQSCFQLAIFYLMECINSSDITNQLAVYSVFFYGYTYLVQLLKLLPLFH